MDCESFAMVAYSTECENPAALFRFVELFLVAVCLTVRL